MIICLKTFAETLYGPFAFLIPVFVAMSTFGGVNGILLTSSRLFYAGAVEGQMPEIFSMIQVNKMTPAPAVIISVNTHSLFYPRTHPLTFSRPSSLSVTSAPRIFFPSSTMSALLPG